MIITILKPRTVISTEFIGLSLNAKHTVGGTMVRLGGYDVIRGHHGPISDSTTNI